MEIVLEGPSVRRQRGQLNIQYREAFQFNLTFPLSRLDEYGRPQLNFGTCSDKVKFI